MKRRLTTYAASLSVTKLAVPLILTNFAYVALTTIDVIILGKLGSVELAAGGLAITLFNQFKTTGTGLITGLSNLVAAEVSVNINQNERRYELLTAGIFWAVASSFLFILTLLFLEQPLYWLGQKEDIIKLTIPFLMIIAAGMLPALLIQVFRHFITGLKQPGPLLLMTIIAVGISIVSNYMLVFGHMGFPALGISGVAISTLLTLLLSLVIFYCFLWSNDDIRPYLTFSSIKLKKWAVISVFRLGWPIAATYAAEAGFFTVLTLIVGSISIEALAAQTVITQIMYIVLMISSGFSHSVSVHISEAVGKGRWLSVRQLAITALFITLIICTVIAISYCLYPYIILSWLTTGENTSQLAVKLTIHGLLIAGILQYFDAIQNIGTGLLRGLNDTITPMKWSLIGYWLVGIPVAWLLGINTGLKIYGVWIGLGSGLAVTGVFLLLLFKNKVKSMSEHTSTTSHII